MAYKYAFEKLDVWVQSKNLIKAIYVATQAFPTDEKYGLISQINRAAVSVASNIAEGSARASRKDQGHFSQMAYGSLMEVACQLLIAQELGYLSEDQHGGLRSQIESISKQLNSLRNYQLSGSSSASLNSSTPQPLNR